MGGVLNFFQWLYGIIQKALALVVSIPGLILSGVAGIASAIGTAFSQFTWLDSATNYVNSVTAAVRTLVNSNHGSLGDIFLGWFALDRLSQCVATLAACTIGATIIACITIFAAIFVCIPGILGIRALCKGIRTFSGGVVSP